LLSREKKGIQLRGNVVCDPMVIRHMARWKTKIVIRPLLKISQLLLRHAIMHALKCERYNSRQAYYHNMEN
jgi:hypothetical protein